MVGNVTAEDLRQVVERLGDGLMLFDREGRLLYLNAEAERILGRPGSELVGKYLRETMPEVVSNMREGARERLLAGEEVLLVRSFFALERWFEILGRPLGGSFLVHFHDITERLQAEAARRRSEERFQILVNGVADYAIFMLDPKGHMASWNAAAERISGYPAEEVLGEPLAFIFPPELVQRGEPRRWLEETVRHGSFKTEAHFFRRDGSPIILQTTNTCLFDELGAPSGFAIVAHDITEQRKMEESLRINEERLRLAVEAGAVGTWEDILGEGRLVANSQFFTITGLPPSKQLSFDEFLAVVHPDDLAQHEENRRRVLDSEAGSEFQWEYRAIRGTDKSLRWLEVHGRVLETPEGSRRVLGVLRDRTREHEMEEFREETNRHLQHANEEIAEAAARTREVIELSPDAFFLTDMDLRITEVNAAACRMLGYERNEVVGKKSFFDLVRPEDAGRLEQAKAEMVTTGEMHRGEWVQVRKGGTTGVVETTANILPGGRLQAFVRDCTERKQAENIRQRLATIVLQSNDAIISQDLEGNILTWNRSAERLYGYSEAEALKMNIAATVPEEGSEMLAHLDAARHGRQAPPVEVKRRAKDGRILDVWWTAAPLFEDGRQVGIVTTARDITERKKLERERQSHLDAMERFYRVSALFLSEQPAGAVLQELLDTAIAISQADFGNIQILDPTSAHLDVVAHRNLPDWWLDYWAGAMGHGASGTALAARKRIVVEDVTQSPIFVGTEALDVQLRAGIRAVQSTPLISRSGALIGVISTHWKAPHRIPEQTLRLLDLLARRAADLIERVQMEAALRDAVQARDQVLGIVAHDLRNPLTQIMMQSKLMHRPSSEPERRNQQPAEVISRAAARMNRLIQDLLDVTRLEAGRLPVERRPLSPGALAAEAVEMEVAHAASSRIDLRLALETDLPDVWVDRDRLLQVFENLIGNAMKFTKSGGRITVGAEARNQEVLFWVKDTGVGISAEDLPHVFDRFWQAAAGAGLGAGLGLSITKGIVEAHGGRIWVESTAGRGSNFYFSIPTGRPEEDRPHLIH